MNERTRQEDYIAYAQEFSDSQRIHCWLGGSFRNGTSHEYSDVDLALASSNPVIIRQFIYGYSDPIFISKTDNPKGILVLIYANGVAVDLEIISQADVSCAGDTFFHLEDYKKLVYMRNEEIWKSLVLKDEAMYHQARLFHRCLLKFLTGKIDAAYVILYEIAGLCLSGGETSELGTTEAFKHTIEYYLCLFNNLYQLPPAYANELDRLTKLLDK